MNARPLLPRPLLLCMCRRSPRGIPVPRALPCSESPPFLAPRPSPRSWSLLSFLGKLPKELLTPGRSFQGRRARALRRHSPLCFGE